MMCLFSLGMIKIAYDYGLVCYRNCRPCSLQSSSKNVSIFDKRLQKSQEPKSTGELAMVRKSHVLQFIWTQVYVDKINELVESLLADGHYNLCNSDFAQ